MPRAVPGRRAPRTAAGTEDALPEMRAHVLGASRRRDRCARAASAHPRACGEGEPEDDDGGPRRGRRRRRRRASRSEAGASRNRRHFRRSPPCRQPNLPCLLQRLQLRPRSMSMPISRPRAPISPLRGLGRRGRISAGRRALPQRHRDRRRPPRSLPRRPSPNPRRLRPSSRCRRSTSIFPRRERSTRRSRPRSVTSTFRRSRTRNPHPRPSPRSRRRPVARSARSICPPSPRISQRNPTSRPRLLRRPHP